MAIRHVVFAAHAIGTVGGLTTVIDTLAHEFARQGLSVSYISCIEPPEPPRVDGPLFITDRWWQYTTFNPLAPKFPGPLAIKPTVKRLFTPVWLAARWTRCRFYARSLSETTAVIFCQVEPAAVILPHSRRSPEQRPLLIGQIHTSLKGILALNLQDAVRDIAANVDVFLALSEADAADLRTHLSLHEVEAMPNPTDLRPSTNIERSTPRLILYAGRLSGEKRVDRILEAFIEVRQSIDDCNLVICGDGPERQHLEAIAEESAAHARIHFRGVVRDIGVEYSRATVAILASDFEGLPMTVIEAARCGVPTVMPPVSKALSRFIDDCGYPAASNSASDLAATLRTALTDSTVLAEKSAHAREASEIYDSTRVAATWVALFATAKRAPERGSRSLWSTSKLGRLARGRVRHQPDEEEF